MRVTGRVIIKEAVAFTIERNRKGGSFHLLLCIIIVRLSDK